MEQLPGVYRWVNFASGIPDGFLEPRRVIHLALSHVTKKPHLSRLAFIRGPFLIRWGYY
jgi:hypothetical protein